MTTPYLYRSNQQRVICGEESRSVVVKAATAILNPCHPGLDRGMWWQLPAASLADRIKDATRRQHVSATPDEGNRHCVAPTLPGRGLKSPNMQAGRDPIAPPAAFFNQNEWNNGERSEESEGKVMDEEALRDFFACYAMQSFVGRWGGQGFSDEGGCSYAHTAQLAYKMADALLAERAKNPRGEK